MGTFEDRVRETASTIAELDASSAAGELPAALVKAAATATWNVESPKSKREIQIDQWISKGTDIMDDEEAQETSPRTVSRQQKPFRTIHLLTHIIQLSIQAGTIPATQKRSVVTGLPKGAGQINSTKALRPISVGPVVGKIINKLVARRFANTLVAHGMLDPAQFAFLPGKGIHEAINAVLAGTRQSNEARNGAQGRACYTLFYDISKAYDCVRWSSIEQALVRLKAPRTLINFVIQSLQGSTLAMKVGTTGRTTKQVEIHKAIKQGCPLAPSSS